MINGIEVLNQTVIYQHTIWIGIFGIMTLVFAVAVLVCMALDYEKLFKIFVGIELFAWLASMISLPIQIPSDKYEYSVIITNDVDMDELAERYEIVKQEGKVYTIIEKE